MPGKKLDDPTQTPNQLWNGMGKGTVTGVKSPSSYANATVIPSGTYTYTWPGTYPSITVDNKTYTYDQAGSTSGTYSIEVLRLVTAGGANAGNNGYNQTVGENIPTFHLDTRIVLHDSARMQVGFYLKDAGSNEFELDNATNVYYDINTPESEIAKPEVEQTVTLKDGTVWQFSGWYEDENFQTKAEFTGNLTSNKTYYGKYEQVGSYQVYYRDGTSLFDFGEGVNNPEEIDINEGYVVKGSNTLHDQSGKHLLVGWVTEEGKNELSKYISGNGNIIINKQEAYEAIVSSEYFRKCGMTYNDNAKNGEIINLYAIWALDTLLEAKVNIIYKENGASSGSVPVDTNKYYSDSKVTVLGNTGDLQKEGYTFAGWSLSENGDNIINPGEEINLLEIESIQEGAKTLTLYAQWSINSYGYTVEYYYDGAKGNAPEGAATGGDAEFNSTVTINPEKTVKVDDNNYVLVSKEHKVTIKVANNVIKVEYELDNNGPEGGPDEIPDAEEYAITYDKNAETAEGQMSDPNIYPVGYNVPVQENKFTNTGYSFASWNTQADGEGETAASTIEMIEGGITLYAQWSINSYGYTVEYYYDGAKGNAPEGAATGGDAEFNSTVTINPEKTVKVDDNNYVLVSKEHKVTIKVANNVIKVEYELDNNGPEGGPDEIPDAEEYAITYDKNAETAEGQMSDPNIYPVGYNVPVQENKFTNTGYSFASWNTQADGEGETAASTIEMIEGGITLYAQWSINSYNLTIKYVDEDGTELQEAYEKKYEYGEKYEKESPAFEGYTLLDKDQSTISGNMPAEDEVITVVYGVDVNSTDPNNPDSSDGIPDKYQARVDYVVSNGTFDFSYTYVTLFDENGNWSETGKGTLEAAQIPTAIANAGYDQNSFAWQGNTPVAGYEITGNTTFNALFNAIPVTPTPTPDGGGTTTPTTPTTPGARTTDDGATTDEPEVEEVEDEETPLSDGDVEDVEDNATPKGNNGIWALINLIAAIVTVILGLILLLSKRHRNDEEEDEEERQARIERGEEKEQEQKRGWICKVLGVIVAIVSVVFFILTEDMSLPMALTDKWTIWMIVIAIVELVLVLVGRHWKDVDDEDQEQQA